MECIETSILELNRPRIRAASDLSGFVIESPQDDPNYFQVRGDFKLIRVGVKSPDFALLIGCHSDTKPTIFWRLHLEEKTTKWSKPNKLWISTETARTPKLSFSDILIVDRVLGDLKTALETLGCGTRENTASIQRFRDLALASLKH